MSIPSIPLSIPIRFKLGFLTIWGKVQLVLNWGRREGEEASLSGMGATWIRARELCNSFELAIRVPRKEVGN